MAARNVLKPKIEYPVLLTALINFIATYSRIVNVVFLGCVWVLMGWGLYRWGKNVAKTTFTQIVSGASDKYFDLVEAELRRPVSVPPFETGQENRIADFLKNNPIIIALVSNDGKYGWKRCGYSLIKASDPSDLLTVKKINTVARLSDLEFVYFDETVSEDFRNCLVLGIKCTNWVVVKRISPGSQSFDSELKRINGNVPLFKFHLRLLNETSPVVQPFDKEIQQQVPTSDIRNRDNVWYWNRYEPEGWEWRLFPGELLQRQLRLAILKKYLIAVPSMLLGLAVIVFAVWGNELLRARAKLNNDRLASMIHGLKTPLAILKMRCDAIRLGQLDQDTADKELIKVGDEIDQLSMAIQNGLQVARGKASASAREVVSRQWLDDLVEEFEGMTHDVGRNFVYGRIEGPFTANLFSLRQVLQTFFDNALVHGEGRISLLGRRTRSLVMFELSDEGPGLEPFQLEALGQPFLRFRKNDAEGFEHPGMGLGVSLAIQIARQEGWGITFESNPGEGFRATLAMASRYKSGRRHGLKCRNWL